MSTLEEFVSHVRDRGITRTNRFIVQMPLPAIAQSYDNGRLLCLMCESVSYPGRTIASQTGTVGKIVGEVPYAQLDDDTSHTLNLTFYVDGDCDQLTTLENWNFGIASNNRGVKYLDDVTTTLSLQILSMEDQVVKAIVFYDVWLKSWTPINLRQENGTLMKIETTFAFSHWEPDNVPLGGPATMFDEGGSNWDISKMFKAVKPYLAAKYPIVGQIDSTINDIKTVGNVIGGIGGLF